MADHDEPGASGVPSGGNSGGFVGGDNEGVFVSGDNNGTIAIGPAAQPRQQYERKAVRLLPITERGLQIGSALATIAVFLTGYQNVAQAWEGWQHLKRLESVEPTTVWLFAFMSALVAAVILITALGVAHNRTHHYSRFSFLPGIAGVRDGRGKVRLALVRNQGKCMHCGGGLRFYARVTQSHQEYDPEAGRWREVVDARDPVAECKRNPRHVWLMDASDTDDLTYIE